MQKNIIKKRLLSFACEKTFHISLGCRLVPIPRIRIWLLPICIRFVCLFVCLFVSFLLLSWSADCRSIMFDVYLYRVQA